MRKFTLGIVGQLIAGIADVVVAPCCSIVVLADRPFLILLDEIAVPEGVERPSLVAHCRHLLLLPLLS